MALIHMNFRSDALMYSVHPVVLLPDYTFWKDAKKPYRTLYFLNGYSGGGFETATFTNMTLYALNAGFALVLVDGENSFYADDPARERYYSHYVGREIVEVTRRVFPLSHEREDTWIGGISMGGYGALINGLRYSDTFSKIAMLSPALGCYPAPGRTMPEEFPIHASLLLHTLGVPEAFYGSYKDERTAVANAVRNGCMPETLCAIGRQDMLYAGDKKLVDEWKAMGAPITWQEGDGEHDHVFWKAAMPSVCDFLTKKKEG